MTFSKNFDLLDTKLIYSQCEPSWMYHSLERATDAIIKCETGLHLWKFFTTPAWYSLVKYCSVLDKWVGSNTIFRSKNYLAFIIKLVLVFFYLWLKWNQISFTLYSAQQGRQREPSVKVLCSPLWRYCVLSGRTQRRPLPRHRREEMEI